MTDRFAIVVIAELATGAIEPFDDYERLVLPLLGRHGGQLERRLRTADARTEVHLLSFPTRAGYESYLADPDRAALRRLLDCVDVHQRVLEVHDVPAVSSQEGQAGSR